MRRLRALVAAAGSGSRAGLPYPKTLHPVLGRPILIRILDLLQPLDPHPTIIVSPSGEAPIAASLVEHRTQADLVVQPAPTGMGDAILCFRNAPAFADAEDLLVVWGDIPLVQPETLAALAEAHLRLESDFTFVTRQVDRAYTIVSRDEAGRVRSLIETREAGLEPAPGERDIGLFVFRARPVLELLARRLPGARGRSTSEHGFLYIVEHLARAGLRIEALPIATEQDLISLNSLADLAEAGI